MDKMILSMDEIFPYMDDFDRKILSTDGILICDVFVGKF